MKQTPVKVGDRRTEKPLTFGDGQTYEGRVIYVHPTGRWYTVEFKVVPLIRRRGNYGGMIESKGAPVKIRESFLVRKE